MTVERESPILMLTFVPVIKKFRGLFKTIPVILSVLLYKVNFNVFEAPSILFIFKFTPAILLFINNMLATRFWIHTLTIKKVKIMSNQ